jgi:glycine cleavage system H protein
MPFHPVYMLREHAWTRPCADGTVVVGVDEDFLNRAGQIVYLDLPEEGDEVARERRCARSIDASGLVQTSFRCPLSGTVVEVNEELHRNPWETVRDPYGNGWLFRVAPAG